MFLKYMAIRYIISEQVILGNVKIFSASLEFGEPRFSLW